MNRGGMIVAWICLLMAWIAFICAALLVVPAMGLFLIQSGDQETLNARISFFASLFRIETEGSWMAFIFVFPAYALMSAVAGSILLTLG
ncbi:MAG: hypothetical protein AAB634_00015, partial [Patescibacteria group bacterium]